MPCHAYDFLRKAIDDSEGDWAHLKAMAEWLEKIGDWRAPGYRWMVDNRKRPCTNIEWFRGNFTWHRLSGTEFSGRRKGIFVISDDHAVGSVLFHLLMNISGEQVYYFTGFETRADAEEAVCIIMRDNPNLLDEEVV